MKACADLCREAAKEQGFDLTHDQDRAKYCHCDDNPYIMEADDPTQQKDEG